MMSALSSYSADNKDAKKKASNYNSSLTIVQAVSGLSLSLFSGLHSFNNAIAIFSQTKYDSAQVGMVLVKEKKSYPFILPSDQPHRHLSTLLLFVYA